MSRYLRPIKKGEYDLANISNIGVDPITGRTFDACNDEWLAVRDFLIKRADRLRWWDLLGRWRWAGQFAALQSHLGW